MPHILVTPREGETRALPATVGRSVMEIIRDNGVDQLLALSGVAQAGSTCDVYGGETFRDRLPAMSDDEDDLLNSSGQRAAGSRLSCQIVFDPTLDGLAVTIAPED